MKQRIISIIAAALMFFIFCSCNAEPNIVAAPVDGDVVIEEEVYTGNGSAWCSELFELPATSYNNKLALVAADMSEAAENDSGNDETIRTLFSSYSLYACEYYNFDGAGLFSAGGAFAIGQDTLTINGVNTTVLVVAARGTINFQEMVGDLFKGGEVDFLNTKVWANVYDFEEKIWDGLNDYITRYPAITSKESLKILITGHSLGGAAANMFGARLTAGVGSNEWWGSKISKDDIYVYTFGAIKVLTTETNMRTGYDNIHNIYNYYDSYGPNGNQKNTNVSSINAKFGHTELYYLQYEESGPNVWDSCNSHLMSNYKDALNQFKSNASFIELACESEHLPEIPATEMVPVTDIPTAAEPPSKVTDSPTVNEFSIEGTWKSIGAYGFGQAQPGSIVAFDGMHCNFYSPYDTYAFYRDNGQWRLDCTSFLFSETLSFRVEIIDANYINVYYGSNCTELRRTN